MSDEIDPTSEPDLTNAYGDSPRGQGSYSIPTPQAGENPGEIAIDAPRHPDAPKLTTEQLLEEVYDNIDSLKREIAELKNRQPSTPESNSSWAQTAQRQAITQPFTQSRYTNLRPDIFLSHLQQGAAFNEATTNGGAVQDFQSTAGRASNGTDGFAAKIVPLGYETMHSFREDGNSSTYFFGPTRFVFKVTSNAGTGGKYFGKSCGGNSTATASGTLSMPEGLSVSSTEDVLALNLAEDASATHNVNTGLFFTGAVVGLTGDTPPKWKVLFSPGGGGSNATTGFSGTTTRVTAVSYNTTTHVLSYTSVTDTYTNGLLTSSSGSSSTTIDTATVC